jgi:hypothetical protein
MIASIQMVTREGVMPMPDNDWLDKHEAARLTGYNERVLTNKARAGALRAERRPLRAGQQVKTWYFWRPDLERLVSQPVPDV